jgi:TRAP-type C4-dicarboxylate transport system permease small subunit
LTKSGRKKWQKSNKFTLLGRRHSMSDGPASGKNFWSIKGFSLREKGAFMSSKIIQSLSNFFNAISSVCLFGSMILIGADVFCRYVFNAPISGTLEITEQVPVIATVCAFAYTASLKRHIKTTFFEDRLSNEGKHWMQCLSNLLMFAFLSILVWQTAIEFLKSYEIREYSQGLIAIPRYPVKLLIPLGLGVGWLYYLKEFIGQMRRKESKP